MPSSDKPVDSSPTAKRANGLLYALNSAAAQIQRSARSEADVFRAFYEQIVKIGLRGSVTLLSEDGKSLHMAVVAIDQEELSQLGEIALDNTLTEWFANAQSIHFSVPLQASKYLMSILETGHSVFEPDNSQYLSEIIPDGYKPFADLVVARLGNCPLIISPLVIAGQARGLLSVNGPGLTIDDVPAVEAFANHTAVALENARLFAQMQSQVLERKQAEDALRESEQKYRSIVRQSSDGIILVDENGLIIEWNEAQERITGYTQAQVLGRPIWEVQFELSPEQELSDEFKLMIIKGTKEFLAQGYSPWMVQTQEHDIRRSDGELRAIQVAIFPLETEKGYRICSIVRDVTDYIGMNRALRKRADELAVLQSLSLELTQVHELPVLLRSIVDKAVQLLGARGGSLYLCEPENEQVRLYVEQKEESFEYIGYTMKYGEGAAGRVVLSGEPLIIDDYRAWSGRPKGYENIKPHTAVLTVPMIWQGEVTGVLQVLDDTHYRRFTQADQELLTLFANHAAVALETTRLLEAERRRRQEAETLVKASAALTSTLDVEQLLKVILTHLEKVVPYDSASVFLLAENQLHIVAARGFPDTIAVEGSRIPLEQDQLFLEIQKKKRSLILDDVHNDPRFHGWGGVQHVRGWMGVPLVVQGQVIGCLTLDNRQPGVYHAGHVSLAEAFANQAAAAIEKSRLFQAERNARLRAEALRDAVQVISSTLSLQQVLETVLEQLARVLPFDSGNIMLLEQNYAVVKVWHGYQQAVFRELSEPLCFALSPETAVGTVINGGEPLMIVNVQEDPRWQETSLSQHIRSWLGVPLLVRGKVIGLLNLDRCTMEGFSQDEVALAQTFASHAAVAIDNAWMFESEERRAAELEALHNASLSLTSSLELEEVLDSILESAARLLPEVSEGYIFLYSNDSGGQLQYGASLPRDGCRVGQSIDQELRELTYQVAKSGEILIRSDFIRKPDSGSETGQQCALISLPLRVAQEVVGVMDIIYHQPRSFSETEVRLMRLLGDQAAIAIENARLYHRAATERRHLQLLYDVNREVINSLDYDETLNRAVSLTCQVFGGILGQAFLYLPETGRLRLSALYGDGAYDRSQFNQHVEIDLGVGLAGWVAAHRQAVNVPDVREDGRWYHVPGLDDGVCSVISAPISSGERLFGVLSVLHNQVAAFSNDQLDLLQAICREVGLALSNTDRYQEVKRRLAEITLIQNLAQTFSQRLELSVLLDEVVQQLFERFNYPLVEIFLIKQDQLVLQTYRGNSPKVVTQSIQQGIVGRVARTGEVNFIPDVTNDPEYYCCSPETVAELAVPIFRDEEVVGVINIETHIAGQLTEHDRDLLQVLAGQISVALENAVLYEQVREHAIDLEQTVSKRTRELSNLYELSQKIGYTLGYDESMRLVLSHLRRAIGCEIASGCLVLGGNKLYYIETKREVSATALSQIHKYSVRGLGRRNEKTKQLETAPVELIHTDVFDSQSKPLENLESIIYVPIVVGQKHVGTLIAASEREKAFSDYQVRLLETFAHQAATAIERIEVIQAAEQKRLEGLVEHLPVGVVLLDADYRILVVNPLARTILTELDAGIDAGYLSRLGDLSVDDLIYRHLEPLPVEIILEGPPRRVFEIQVRAMGQGSPQRVMTLRDVSQEREIQARIQMQDRLATVGQLAAGIAHDFNNIMAAILVYTDLLLGDPNLPKSSRDRLVIIEQQVQRAASLIRQILDFSRRAVMEQSTLDLLPFIKELERMLGRVMPETIRLELTYNPGAYLVNADPTRLQQVFINLAVNARDAMPEGGALHFALARYTLQPGEKPPLPDMQPGEWIKITVRDTGTGIPPDVLPHIFEPFFTTKPVGQGTGLGLAQVYGIIKQHDGHIDVSSVVGRGTEFNIYLPAIAEPNFEKKHTEPLTPLDGKGKVVLVVEDDQATLAALQALLEARNYDVITARNGYEAIQQYDRSGEDIALVVSDVVMPQMDGVKLYNALMERSPDTKILFVTGHPLQGESQALLERGDVHWLQKPFSAREFTRLVQGLLEA